MVKLVIFNELSNARNPNNMQVLHTVLQHSPEQAPKVKARNRDRLILINVLFYFILFLSSLCL